MKTNILKALVRIFIVGIIIYLFVAYRIIRKDINIIVQAEAGSRQDISILGTYINQNTQGNFAGYVQSLQKK